MTKKKVSNRNKTMPKPPKHSYVAFKDGNVTTTSLVVAKHMDYEHATVIKLIRKNSEALETFGRVRFEIRPFETEGGEQKRELAILNEEQTALLLSFMKNTKKVKTFKVALIKEFYMMCRF